MSVRALVVAFVWMIAASSVLLGQGRSSKWWEEPEVKTALGLTEQQSQHVEEVFQTMLPKLRAIKDDLDRLESSLSRLIAEAAADEATVVQQIDRVEAARGEMSKLRTLMLYRMHRVLTPEQRVKLKDMHDRDRSRSGRRNRS